jgi:prevent-host-death family protein
MKATAKDLRFHSKDLLDTVGRGEEVVITFRGKPCARLIPFETGKKESKNDFFGIRRDDEITKDVDNYVREIRKGRF